MSDTRPRRIWLCADDYGLSPGVNAAIRDVLERGRINATSVMTVTPAFTRDEVSKLAAIKVRSPHIAIGLHVTLTAPFTPLTGGDAFAGIGRTLQAAMLRRLDRDAIAHETLAQLAAFQDMFGASPDFVDGHQHVQTFPQIREAVVAALADALPRAWLRQCGRVSPLAQRLSDGKGMLLDMLSTGLRKTAKRSGVAFNPGFAGSYAFTPDADYAALFPKFLRDLPEHAVVMCHPGFVDDTLKRLDPLTDLREREHGFFVSEAFPQILARHRITLS
ncbi:MAG: ChbG/HpnK family deacetylase [Pseudorhodoplanes sp.]